MAGNPIWWLGNWDCSDIETYIGFVIAGYDLHVPLYYRNSSNIITGSVILIIEKNKWEIPHWAAAQKKNWKKKWKKIFEKNKFFFKCFEKKNFWKKNFWKKIFWKKIMFEIFLFFFHIYIFFLIFEKKKLKKKNFEKKSEKKFLKKKIFF